MYKLLNFPEHAGLGGLIEKEVEKENLPRSNPCHFSGHPPGSPAFVQAGGAQRHLFGQCPGFVKSSLWCGSSRPKRVTGLSLEHKLSSGSVQ
ncbi:hypothetical protein CEXT_51661 [Caerostris extrusa]|uniref:Uncharacterized protein n=1 Tax=Caerostris extrusa TaxID=172846 RepID=A0AAV4Y1X9_CAEEX|nr:hypothetical protein CEXT_51661 [Caerostris extrusa]